MADVQHRDPRDWLECVQEPDATVSIQETKEGGPASTATPGIKREGEEVVMTTVRASDLPPLDVNGTNPPRTRVGRGLESIGGMTADTFQRFTTVVGGVVKSPVALMAKVGSLASPQSANRTSPLAASRTSSEAASPILPLPASPTSPKAATPTSSQAASLILPEAENPTLSQAQSLTSPQAPSPILPEEANLALPEEASLALPEASIPTSPEEASLALPEAASVTSTPNMSLEERVWQLEIQMKSFEERLNLGTVVTELNVSSRSLEENPRLARSLMQEMETEGTLEKRVQMLEESLHERMESVEKALLIIQSQLAHVDLSKYESVAGYDSPSGELEFYDAEQQVEILEILELNSLEELIAGARYERGEATEASAPLEEIPATKTVPSTAELVHEIDAGRSSDVSLEPQLARTSVEYKQFFLPELMEVAALNAELVERSQELHEPMERAQELDAGKSGYVLLQPQAAVSSVESTEPFVKEPREAAARSDVLSDYSAQREDSSIFPVSSDRQLVSTLSDLHEAFVTEPSAAAASAKFLDIARADSAEKSSIAPVYFEPQSASVPEIPQEAFEEQQPLIATSVVDFEEPTDEDVIGKSVTEIVDLESPLAPLLETPHTDSATEPLTVASSAESAQELANNEDSDMARTPSELQAESKFMEEPSAALLSANLDEPAQEDAAEKSATMLAAKESPYAEELPSASSFGEPQEDFAEESLAAAPSAELAQVLATNEAGYTALASSDTQVASRFAEEPLAAIPSNHFEELAQDNAQEDAADKSKAMLSAEESPLLASSEEPEDNPVKESLAAAPSAGLAHGLATEASDDVAPAFSEPQVASRSAEFPSATVPNDSAKKPAEELPLLSSYVEPQEDFVKESLAGVPSAGLAQGLASEAADDVGPAFIEPQVASRALEYQSAATPNYSVEESAQEDVADKSGTMLAAEESPLMSSFEEPEDNSVQKSLAAKASDGLAYELLIREDSNIARASSEPQETSRSVEEPLAAIPRASFEEPVRDIAADGSGTMLAAENTPLLSSVEEPQEESVKESLAATPSPGPVHGSATEASDDVALAFSEPQVASKFVEYPSAAVPSDHFEEPAQEDAANESETMLAAAESPLLSSSEEHEDNPLEKSLAGAPSAGPAHGLATEASDDVPLAFSLPQVASKSVGYPSAAVPNENSEEPAQEDAAKKSGTMLAAVDSPLLSSLQEPEPEDDTAKDSLVAAPTAVPAYGFPLQEDSGGYSDVTVPEPRAASTTVEELSVSIPSANSEAPAREDAMDKDGTMLAPMVSAASFEDSQEGFEKEILAPAEGSVTREDSDVAPASSNPQGASKFAEEPSAAVSSANLEAPAQEDADDISGTNFAAKVLSAASSFEEPEIDTGKESLVDAPSAGTARELLPQVNSSGCSDTAVAEPQVASITEEDPSAAISSANFDEPAREHAAEKSGTMLAAQDSPSAEESPSAFSFEESQEVFAKDSLAAAPSAEPAQKLETNKDSDMAPAFSEPHVAPRSVEEPSAAVPSANFEEPAHEDVAEKSDTMLAAKESPSTLFGFLQPLADGLKLMIKKSEESPSASSFEEPQEVFAKDSLAVAPSAEPAQKLETNEDSDMARASPDIQVASRSAEEPSAAVPSANFEEPAQEDVAEKSVSVLAAKESPSVEESPSASSFGEIHEDFEKESLAAAPSAGSAHEMAVEDSNDVAPVFSEPQVASKSVEDPSAVVPSANFEVPAHEDARDRNRFMLAAEESPPLLSSFEEPQEDFMKESLPVAPSAGPAHGLETEASGGVAPAFPEPQLASRALEYQSAAIPNDGVEEPAQEDAQDRSGTSLAAVSSPLLPSFEEPENNSVQKSLIFGASAGPAYELATREDSDMGRASSEPQEASRSVEEPSAAIPNASFEEPAQKDVADKNRTTLAAGESPLLSSSEEPEVNPVKESLAAAPYAGPAHGLATEASDDVAPALSEPQVASKFVEKPSAAVPSASFEEPAQEDAHEDAADKSGTILAAEESPFRPSFEEPQDDSVKESLAAAPTAGPAHGLASEANDDVAPAFFEPQLTSRALEYQSAAMLNDSVEEPAQEYAADKSETMLVAEKSPLPSVFEEPQEDYVKESLGAAPSAWPVHGLTTKANDDIAPDEPQVTSKFVKDPSAAVPSDSVDEPAQEDVAEKSGTMPAAVVSLLASSLQEPEDDSVKESVVAGASAKILEPAQEEDSENSATAQEALVKEPSGGGVQLEGPAQEKSGTWMSTVEEPQNVPVGEVNYAPKEAEYKLAEDVKVPDEHVKDTEEVSPKIQSNLAHVDSDKRKPESLASQESDERVESGDSGEEFFDAEQESGHFEAWDSGAHKSFEESVVGPAEASGSTAVAEKSLSMESLVPSPSAKPAQEPENFVQEPAQEHGHELATQEYEHQLAQEHGYEPAQELAHEHKYEPARKLAREPVKFEEVPAQAHEQQPAQEPALENLAGESDVALASSEPVVSAEFDHPQELLAEERLAAEPRVKFEEPAQANAADENDTRDLPLMASKVEEPQIDTVGSSEENLSIAKFHESGNPELVENLKQKSLDEADIAVDTPGIESTPHEALGKVPLTTSAPTTVSNDSVLEHDVERSDHVHIPSELQLASASEESKEARVNEPMKVTPNFESSTERAQEGDDGAVSASSEPQVTATPQKSHEDFAKELSAAALSAFKSGEPEESLAEEPRAVTPTSKLAKESGADKSSPGLVEGSPLTAIEEEPRYRSVSSIMEGKHRQNKVGIKPTEDVNFPPGLIEEAFPRSQSDSTVTKLKPEAAQVTEDRLESVLDEKHHDQGSFLAFASLSVHEEEPSPAAKLVQLFEREDVRRSGNVRQYSPATSMVTEPVGRPAVESLAAVSSSPKVEGENHARRRSFSRSTSEPQFVYKSGDHRHALAKEPSVVVVAAPSASNLEQHAEGSSADVQCLPFKLLGEGKPRKESELKLAEDVYGSARKTEPAVSYVLEPKPSRIKEKKKREKKDKERKHESPPVEEKATRRSFRSGEMERKGSVREEEKDSSTSTNSLLRSEEKHKQPSRHWRDRLRHAFGSTKDA